MLVQNLFARCRAAELEQAHGGGGPIHGAEKFELGRCHGNIELLTKPLRREHQVVAEIAQQRLVAQLIVGEIAHFAIDGPRHRRLAKPLQQRLREPAAIVNQGVKRGHREYAALRAEARELRARDRPRTRSDRYEQELVLADLPADSVTLERCQHQHQQRRIVMRAHAAIDKDAGDVLGNLNALRRKEGRCGGAGTHQRSQGKIAVGDTVRIAVARSEIRPSRTIVENPYAARVHALGHYGETRTQLLRAESDVAEEALNDAQQRPRTEFRDEQAAMPATAGKAHARELQIALNQRAHFHTERQSGRNDRARRGAANEIEVIAEPERIAVALTQDLFETLEIGERNDAANAAAVERENPLRAGFEKVTIAFQGEIGFHRRQASSALVAKMPNQPSTSRSWATSEASSRCWRDTILEDSATCRQCMTSALSNVRERFTTTMCSP